MVHIKLRNKYSKKERDKTRRNKTRRKKTRRKKIKKNIIQRGGNILQHQTNFGFDPDNLIEKSSEEFQCRSCLSHFKSEKKSDFFSLKKISSLVTGDTSINLNSNNSEKELYVISHLISIETFKNSLAGIEIFSSNNGWLVKYIRWILFHIISSVSINRHAYIRYIFDYYSYINLDILYKNGIDPLILIINFGFDDYPNNINNDGVNIIDYIKFVFFLYKKFSGNFTIFKDKYIFMLFLASNTYDLYLKALSVGPESLEKVNFQDLINYNLNKIEIFLYEFKYKVINIYNGSHEIKFHDEHFQMIVQLVRYFGLIQDQYEIDGEIYKPPSILHFRDGHATCTSIHSFEFERNWLKTPFKYLIGNNIFYNFWWHDYRKGIFAGFFSVKRFSDEKQFMDIDTYKQTFGRAFCLKKDADEILTIVCPKRTQMSDENQYNYGIDEYCGSYLLLDQNNRSGFQEMSADYLKLIYSQTVFIPITSFSSIFIKKSIIMEHQQREVIELFDVKLFATPTYKMTIEEKQEFIKNNIKNLNIYGLNIDSLNESKKLGFIDDDVIIFYIKVLSFISCVFHYFYEEFVILNKSKLNPDKITWFEILKYIYGKKKAFESSSIIAYLNNENESECNLNQYITDFFLFFCPPVYAFFSTLFNNSETIYWNSLYFKPSLQENDFREFLTSIFRNNSFLNIQSEIVVFLFNYKNLYSVDQTFKDFNNPGFMKYNWDVKSWYNNNDKLLLVKKPVFYFEDDDL